MYDVRWLRFSIRVSISVVCVMLVAAAGTASPCARLKTQPDAWVAARVDALVRAARGAYESDKAIPAYERVLDGIVDMIRQCRLTGDDDFISRYRAFVEYVETVSLDRQQDHELGFLVPDEQYFAETRRFVEIPEFLLEQDFLRSVSRYETLARAKSFLRELNALRDPADQLIFFSYQSRHLGTPDNDASRRRLLIIVHGNVAKGLPDKWVQFGVTDPGTRTRVRNVSIVSAVAGSTGTFNAYFKDFYRSYRRDGSISIKGRWVLAMITARNFTKAAFSLSSPCAVLLVKPSKRLCWQSTNVFSVTDRRVLVVTWTEESLGQAWASQRLKIASNVSGRALTGRRRVMPWCVHPAITPSVWQL